MSIPIANVSVDAQNPVDRVVESYRVLDDDPKVDDALILQLCYDLAQGIHPYETIANRYGFADVAELARYLQTHSAIAAKARHLKATLDSDMGSGERARLKALIASEELVAPIASIAADPKVAAGQRIDAFKQLNRMGGVDGLPSAARSEQLGGGGNKFVVQFNFRGSPPENFVTTVVRPIDVPAIEQRPEEDLLEEIEV